MIEDPCRICGKESDVGVHGADVDKYYCEDCWNLIKQRKIKEPKNAEHITFWRNFGSC